MTESLINQEIIKNLDSKDKQEVLELLKVLIASTNEAQAQFNELKKIYGVLELLPDAIWILESTLEVYYQNKPSYALENILEIIKKNILPNTRQESELEYEGNTYLYKVDFLSNKIVITAIDITAQKRQERLASMGTISAHLAHEIRNPVGSISLLTSSLLKRGNAQTISIATEIKKSIWRIERLINATLLFSKGISINKKMRTLDELKKEIVESIAYYTYTKEITFNFEIDKDTEVFVDFDLFIIVLQNFIFNAIDAIEEGECENGLILLKYVKDQDTSAFFISDNGKKIENEDILFEPFKTTKLKGNGLGLALSKQIIDAHNGEVRLEVHKDSHQKTFIIQIPNR